ncbi:sensory histidine kinase in two-component regulatory system with AtoC [Candidatus Vecturithrix granuli]|uniref:histidine kinase n=1 Tax=Vecturithrix granuli TaxID=1499967 RepID=A0A081C914_VECG1|nr:sensory histidine kinase in two-component regulatory system with AtoC [Candidatus Vecturithrix granuli]
MMSQTTPILQMKNIHVSYEACKALKGVDFDLYQGEIHGLVGEHRAGKSTLVKLLSGVVRKEKGQILFKGRNVEYFTPKSSMQDKIGIIYQHLNVFPNLSAVENVFIGRDLTFFSGLLRSSKMTKKTEEIFARMGVAIQPHVPIEFLSEDQQQMVELAKVLSSEPEIMIFDEISSKLTPDEMEYIYQLLFEFKQQGKSVIYISHNMDEIFEFADRVTILKNGYRLGTEEIKDLDKIKLIKMTYSFVLSREELEQDNRELYLLKKYNEDIIKNLPEGVIILDPENMVYIMNYAAIQILELDHQAIHRQSISRIFKSEALAQANDILSAIETREEQSWDELEYGSEKIIQLHTFPFKDEDYKFLGTILIIQDISKERYLNEYLLRTEKIASIAELAAGVAHEVNNPLGIIQNYVSFLKEQPIGRENIVRLEKVEHELDRIVGIIESLLSFSKFKQMPMKRINLATVLDEVIILISHKLKEKQIRFLRATDDREIPIFGDENRLKQVFINLLMNSIEAVMYDGMIELTTRIHEESRSVEITVSDDGYGIPEEIMPHIFDPFFSTKVGKKNSGLGLSICHHIIEAHQGIITCASGETTMFHVRLPLLAD